MILPIVKENNMKVISVENEIPTSTLSIFLKSLLPFFYHSSSIGGVFLRASNLNSTMPYPTIQVINSEILNSNFFLSF